jgi:signal peptidase II
LAVITAVLTLGLDQYTKYFISSNFELGDGAGFLKGFIDIQYIHNTGGAWGLLSGSTLILLGLTCLIMVFLIIYYVKWGKGSKLLFWSVCLVISGGIGNLIDRVFRDGKVIDFLHFEFYPTFPVFNVADIAVVTGAGLLILYFVLDTIKDSRKAKT